MCTFLPEYPELGEIRPEDQVQTSLFEVHYSEQAEKLNKAFKIIDQLNKNYGKDMVRYATMGYGKSWNMRQNFLSRKYTTRMADIIVVKAY